MGLRYWKSKAFVMLLVLFMAAAGIGISYASINGMNLSGYPSCYCDVAFTSAELGSPADNEIDIDVADATVTLDSNGDSITIELTNAYPGYEAYINFTITNLGNKPIDVNGIINEIYDTTALEIILDGVAAGSILGIGESITGAVTVKVLPGAEQNTVYQFIIDLGFSNDECPQYIHIETIIVEAANPNPTTSSNVLEDGVDYTIVATGTAFAGDTIDFDAKYSITNKIPGDTWTDTVTGYESYGPTLLDLFVNGTSVNWGIFNSDHKYQFNITGDGNGLELLIYDVYYPNNIGNLTVEIFKIIS